MPFFFLVELSVANRAIGSRKVRIFYRLTATLESISSGRLFVFETSISSISVGSVYSGSEGKDTSFKVFKLLLPLKKTGMVFQCKFVKLSYLNREDIKIKKLLQQRLCEQ